MTLVDSFVVAKHWKKVRKQKNERKRKTGTKQKEPRPKRNEQELFEKTLRKEKKNVET